MFLASLLLMSLGARSVAEEPRPNNVILIVLDDVGIDLIGAYEQHERALGRAAGTPATTPAIDNLLAARGVTFTNVWTCPRCSPSRAQILTGRFAHHNGIGQVIPEARNSAHDNAGLSHASRLLPQLLHEAPARYTCAAVGKWHLAGLGADGVDRMHPLGAPHGRWFERYAGSLFNLQDPEGRRGGASSYSSWVKTFASAIRREGDPHGLDQPARDGPFPREVAMNVPPLENYATVDTANDAIALASELREPWFLYVAFNAAHAPVHEVPSGLPRANCAGYEALATREREPNAAIAEQVRRALEEADAQIARIVCALDDSDTTVILISDNGTSRDAILAPYDAQQSKQTLYEGGVRVPLIVRWPGAKPELAGTTDDALVSSTDLFATIAEIAGIASDEPDSRSLVARLRGGSELARRTLYVEEFAPNFTPDRKRGAAPSEYTARFHGQALRDERFKLIRTTTRTAKEGGAPVVAEEFYDLIEGGPRDERGHATRDWFEAHDLLRGEIDAESSAAKALAALRAELDARYPALVR